VVGFSVVNGGRPKICHIHAIVAFVAAMVGIPSQIGYGGCLKICHVMAAI